MLTNVIGFRNIGIGIGMVSSFQMITLSCVLETFSLCGYMRLKTTVDTKCTRCLTKIKPKLVICLESGVIFFFLNSNYFVCVDTICVYFPFINSESMRGKAQTAQLKMLLVFYMKCPCQNSSNFIWEIILFYSHFPPSDIFF